MILRRPVMLVHEEAQTLFTSRREHHQRTTGVRELDDSVPQMRSHARGWVPDEDAGSDLQQPPRQVSAQSWRDGREYDDYHPTSA